MAGLRYPEWRNEQKRASPASHAGFGVFCVVIGRDEIDMEFAAQSSSRFVDHRNRIVQLGARRQEACAIDERPAVVLDVGDFELLRAETPGHLDRFAKPGNIMSVNHQIDGEAHVALANQSRRFELGRVRLHARDRVRSLFRSSPEN